MSADTMSGFDLLLEHTGLVRSLETSDDKLSIRLRINEITEAMVRRDIALQDAHKRIAALEASARAEIELAKKVKRLEAKLKRLKSR